MKTDGTEMKVLFEGEGGIHHFLIVENWIYYENGNDHQRIYRVNIDGSGKQKVNDDYYSSSINVAGDWIYYCIVDNFGYGPIYRIKIDGTGRQQLNDDKSSCINIVDDWIYYRNSTDSAVGGGKLYRIKTNGDDKHKICQCDRHKANGKMNQRKQTRNKRDPAFIQNDRDGQP